MASIVINTVNSEKFSLNGVEYFKIFTSFVSGNMIQIFNIYDRKFELVKYVNYTEIELNSVVYASAILLQAALNDVIYTRGVLGTGSPTELAPRVTVFGNPFFLIKHPNNNNPANINTIEVNDLITEGFFSTTELWYSAQYITAGDINDVNNWKKLNRQTITLI